MIAWFLSAVILSLGLAAAMITAITAVDEFYQLRKSRTEDEVPDFGVFKVREELRTGLAWPAMVAIVTGFFVSMAAAFSMAMFEAWPQPRVGDLIGALGSMVTAMLILASALHWLRADAERVLPGVSTPTALASAMRALNDGHEELGRHRQALEERLQRWDTRLPLYASGWWSIVRRAELPSRLSSGSIHELRLALEGGCSSAGEPTEWRHRRCAGQAAIEHGPWMERVPFHLMWLLPVGATAVLALTVPWSRAVAVVCLAVLAFFVLVVLGLRRCYVAVHGTLVARRYFLDQKRLQMARAHWDSAQAAAQVVTGPDRREGADPGGDLPFRRRLAAAWEVLRGRD